MAELAADVTRHPFLGERLVLKGGTALNLCWGAPSRISVDLDYNYVGSLESEAMLQERPPVERALEELSSRRGYRVQRSPDAFAGRKLFLGFTSASGAPDRIEVDLNFVFRMPVGATEEHSLWQPGGLDHPRVRVVSRTELVIGKLLAFLDRAAPRDAWDVARLPRIAGELLHGSSFRAQFLALSAVLNHPLPTYTRARLSKRLVDRAIREQLFPLLAAGERRPQDDLAERAWAIVTPLLQLTPEESEFIAEIGKGRFRAELLGDPAAANLASHPAIQWKLHNVRAHLRQGPKT